MPRRKGASALARIQFAQTFSREKFLFINGLHAYDRAVTGVAWRQPPAGAAVEFWGGANPGFADG
jgi:hypothetical protein